jgi:hypothetical protein
MHPADFRVLYRPTSVHRLPAWLLRLWGWL